MAKKEEDDEVNWLFLEKINNFMCVIYSTVFVERMYDIHIYALPWVARWR